MALRGLFFSTGILAAALALAGCPRAGSGSPQNQSPPDAGVAVTLDATAAVVEVDGSVPLPWNESIRAGKWSDAWDAIAKLPDAERNKPEVRFARARVAIALKKNAEAITSLEKLEDEMPLLRDSIAKARAQAATEVGPFDKAAEWYASRATPSQWLVGADLYEKANDDLRARALVDRVVNADKKSRAQEEKARTARLRLLHRKEEDPTVIADARWLAIYALDDKTVESVQDLVPKVKPLDAAEWIARSKALADTQRTEDALRAVERAASAKGGSTSPVEICRAKAEVYWKSRSRYAEAALTYRQCLGYGGTHAAENAFLVARSFERGDRDGDAIPAYEKVIQTFPKTTWADQAEFHIGRSYALSARWREAAQSLDGYVRHFPQGHERREADRYRAISHLMAHDLKEAKRLLDDLATNGDDPVQSARFANLAAYAALEDGDKTFAIGRFSEVAKGKPLTWAALVARARLTANNAPLPQTIEPAEAGDAPPALNPTLPPPVDVLHRIGLDSEAEDALKEREGSIVSASNGRGTEALCAAYAMLDRAKRRYQVSLGVPSALLSKAPGPKNRWAWDCVYPRPYANTVHEAETESNLDTGLVWSVMRQESAFDPEVISPARAVGLLQLLPETAKTVATSSKMPFEEAMLQTPGPNIVLGARHLRELLDKTNGNSALAVGSYNAGIEAIQRWQQREKNVPLDVWVEMIPYGETRGYVARVMGNLARYGYLDRGEAGVPRIALDLK